MLDGDLPQLRDRVDDTLRVLGRRTDEERGLPVDRTGHGVDVGPIVVAHRDAAGLEAEVLAALVEGGVGRHRQHCVGRASAAALCPAPFGRLDRAQDALGTAGREEPGWLVVDLVAAEKAGRGSHDLAAHPLQAGEDRRVQRVLPHVEVMGGLHGRVDLLVGVEHQAEGPAPPVVDVALAQRRAARRGRRRGIGPLQGWSWRASVGKVSRWCEAGRPPPEPAPGSPRRSREPWRRRPGAGVRSQSDRRPARRSAPGSAPTPRRRHRRRRS